MTLTNTRNNGVLHACTYKNCDRDDFKSPQALRMHIARKHTKTIKTPGQVGQPHRRTAKMAKLEKPKRVYKRRQVEDESVPVNFCPKCGCSVAMVKMALQVANKMKP